MNSTGFLHAHPRMQAEKTVGDHIIVDRRDWEIVRAKEEAREITRLRGIIGGVLMACDSLEAIGKLGKRGSGLGQHIVAAKIKEIIMERINL